MTLAYEKKINCERARMFPIVKALAKLGHFPTRTTEKEAWFLSPFRSETQASFKVSKGLNRWYDHGEGVGGNVIDLVCKVCRFTVGEALSFLQCEQISFSFHQPPVQKNTKHQGIEMVSIKQLNHPALKSYLKSRAISIEIARTYLKEVHYRCGERTYFAIGLENRSGGWELRNRYFKCSSSPKDVSVIRNGHSNIIVTEGMFDLMSIFENTKGYGMQNLSDHDYLVLNSTAFVETALEIIQAYDQIHIYLDNDSNGRKVAATLMRNSDICIDRSDLYQDFKDINEWLVARQMDLNGHGIQDVSLLPQRPTCFTPDGRKEGKE